MWPVAWFQRHNAHAHRARETVQILQKERIFMDTSLESIDTLPWTVRSKGYAAYVKCFINHASCGK